MVLHALSIRPACHHIFKIFRAVLGDEGAIIVAVLLDQLVDVILGGGVAPLSHLGMSVAEALGWSVNHTTYMRKYSKCDECHECWRYGRG